MPITPTSVVIASDLTDFAGAPFSDDAIAIAVADLQAACRWHIAPSISETVTVDNTGGGWTGGWWDNYWPTGSYRIQLPTLYLVSISAVRDVTDPNNVITLDGVQSAATADFQAGIVSRFGCPWPSGVLEFDITHGYDYLPADLLPVVAAAAQDMRVNRAAGSVRLGSLSISNAGDNSEAVSDRIRRYQLPNIP